MGDTSGAEGDDWKEDGDDLKDYLTCVPSATWQRYLWDIPNISHAPKGKRLDSNCV